MSSSQAGNVENCFGQAEQCGSQKLLATATQTPTPTHDVNSPKPPEDRGELKIQQVVSYADVDSDCDGIINADDNCPLVHNPRQNDKNKNGVGDACDGKNRWAVDVRCDADKDGVQDQCDNCELDIAPAPPAQGYPKELNIKDMLDIGLGSSDADCDGVRNNFDNCVLVFNPDQRDRNANGVGDACEGESKRAVDLRCDTDKDGILDQCDNCISVCNPDQKDTNGNGEGDVCDRELLGNWVPMNPCKKAAKIRTCPQKKKP